jgi:lipopolysaccharide export system permease protein
MYAAGVSRGRLAAPILLFAFLGATATYYINTELMPRTYRVMQENLDAIRADLASAVIRDGEFTKFSDTLTIYVEDTRPGGQFVGILINDSRDEGAPKTYMAERGLVHETDAGPVLFLKAGNIQQRPAPGAPANIIPFEELALNVSTYQNQDERNFEIKERFPRDLIRPDMTNVWQRDNARRLMAEGHARFAGPLYALAYVLIALFAMMAGSYSRSGVVLRLSAAFAVVLTLLVLSFVAQGLATSTGGFWMLYAVPGAAIALSAYLLFLNSPQRFLRRSAGETV